MIRVLGEKLDLREFNVFGAIAFARNGKIPDDLEQRSIVIELHRRKAGEDIHEMRRAHLEHLNRLARETARWAMDNEAEFADAEPDMGGLINRVADNWFPLFAIAEVIGGEWPARARQAAVALAPARRELDRHDVARRHKGSVRRQGDRSPGVRRYGRGAGRPGRPPLG